MTVHNTSHPSRRQVLAGVGGATVVSTAGCLGDDDEEGTDDEEGEPADVDGDYVIGMVDSLTGSLSPYGEWNSNGVELALEDVNDVGVRDGGELAVILEDDESEAQPGVNAAQRLVNQEEVPLFIGSVGSGVSIAMHESVALEEGVVQISQNSTGATLTDYPDLLRMSPSGAAKGEALAELIYEDGHDTVAVTWVNNDYGQALSEIFEQEYQGEVAYIDPHDQEDASYRAQLTEMANTEATAWLFVTYAEEFTVMVNEAYDQGYNEDVEYYGAESTIADEILENTEPGSQETLTGVTEHAPEGQENYEEFADRYESEFGAEPPVWAAYAYDSITVSALAIEAAESFTSEAIADVIRDVTRPEGEEVYTFADGRELLEDGSPDDVNYVGVSGPLDLDENGDPPGFYRIYEVDDHEYVWGDFVEA